jgi:hypothetical protein
LKSLRQIQGNTISNCDFCKSIISISGNSYDYSLQAPKSLSISVNKAGKQITVLENPANSLDLAPGDFFLFPKIKEILKGRHFDDTDDIWSNTRAALKAIPQNQFQNCLNGGLGAGIGA